MAWNPSARILPGGASEESWDDSPYVLVGLDVAKAHRDIARRPTGIRWTVANDDARALAHCAEAIRPVPRPVADAQTEDLRARRARRRQLSAMRPAEPNRLGSAPRRLHADIEAHIPWLHARLRPIDDDLDTTRQARPVWRAREELLRSVPGIGPMCARTLVLDLPALGTLSRQHLAALVGLAPFHRDSGTLRGTRRLWGGRAQVRTALYMRTLGGTIPSRPQGVLCALTRRWEGRESGLSRLYA